MPWLFSYGSNNPRQLSDRIGHADFEVMGAFLNGYERVFRGYSTRWNGGVASLRKKAGATTYGYVSKLGKDDLEILDQYEGVGSGIYERVMVTVQTDAGPLKAHVYIHRSREFNPPSNAYLRAVAQTISTFWRGSDGGAVKVEDIGIR